MNSFSHIGNNQQETVIVQINVLSAQVSKAIQYLGIHLRITNSIVKSSVVKPSEGTEPWAGEGLVAAADSVMLDSHHIRECPPPWRQRAL